MLTREALASPGAEWSRSCFGLGATARGETAARQPPSAQVLGVSLVTSKGGHGVPGSAIVIIAATLNAVPSIPAIGLVLVLSVDWSIGMVRRSAI